MTEQAPSAEPTQSTEPANTEAAPQPASPEAQPPQVNISVKDGKLFINDEPSELTLDDIKKGREMKKAFYSKAEEGARLRKEAQEAFAKLNDPDFLLSDAERASRLEQYFIDKLAREHEQMQAEQMQKDELLSKNLAPEQVELLMEAQKILSENKRMKEENAKREQERAEQERQAALAEYNQKAEAAYAEALKIAGLKPTAKNLREMRDYHMSIIGSEAEDHFGELELSEHLKEAVRADTRETLSDIPDDVLLDFIGEDLVRRINKINAARIQKVGVVNKTPSTKEKEDADTNVSQVLRRGFGWA